MKKNRLKLLSAILSTTMVLSALPVASANAVKLRNIEAGNIKSGSIAVSNNSVIKSQPEIIAEYENYNENCCESGDLSSDDCLPENATVIKSIKEYYEITGKNIPQGIDGDDNNIMSDLPDSIDHSTSKYFPPIGNQGMINSCSAWSHAYYQFAFAMNKQLDREGNEKNIFSPKWVYNFINSSGNNGTYKDHVYNVMKKQGCAPMVMLPYDEDILSWPTNENVWRAALDYRVKDWQYFEDIGAADTQITSADDSDLDLIKTALVNGELLSFSSYSKYRETKDIKSHPSVPENDKYIGQKVYINSRYNTGSHRMTIVGYNDNIWTDINNNNEVDSGEMGAFKIADSYGLDRGNNGFFWVAYDAVNLQSSVPGVTNAPDRKSLFLQIIRIDIKPYQEGANLYLRCTVNSTARDTAEINIIAEKNGVTTSYSALSITSYHFGVNEKYSFNGSTTISNDATMIFPLDNVIEDITPESFKDYNWSVEFKDNTLDGHTFVVKDVEIVDEKNNMSLKSNGVFPFALDKSGKTLSLNITEYNDMLIGDVNNSGDITVLDAVLIMRYNIDLENSSNIWTALADCNNDGEINLKDVICILRYCVSAGNSAYVGEVKPTELPTEKPTAPTEEPTQKTTVPPTEKPTEEPTQKTTVPPTEKPTEVPTAPVEENIVTFTNSLDWEGTIYCYYWSDTNTNMTSWPGKPMVYYRTNSMGQKQYTFEVPQNATHIIFTNGSNQTVNISYSGGIMKYYAKDTTDSKGRYNVSTWK